MRAPDEGSWPPGTGQRKAMLDVGAVSNAGHPTACAAEYEMMQAGQVTRGRWRRTRGPGTWRLKRGCRVAPRSQAMQVEPRHREELARKG